MFLVGITGGVATGKSTVAKILQQYDCAIVDADVIAKEIVVPGKPAYDDIVKKFGSNVIKSDGCLDRAALADIIFQDNTMKQVLNRITHPRIAKTMLWQVFKWFLLGKKYVILDVPLLIESKFWLKLIKFTLVVYCEPHIQVERLKMRNDFSQEEAKKYITGQIPVKDKLKYATHIIDNNGTLEQTKEQVQEFYAGLTQQSSFNLYQWIFILLFVGGFFILLWRFF